MKHITWLIEAIYDETDIQTVELLVSLNDDGWTAKVVEDGEILLCPAGEYFLVSNGHGSAEIAIEAIEAKVKRGFELCEIYANQG